MTLELLKYTLILLALIVFAGWVLITWYKRQGITGMAKTTGTTFGILATVVGGFLALLGKAALVFAKAGVEADAENNKNEVVDHFNYETGEVDGGSGIYLTDKGVDYKSSPIH